MSIQKAEPKKLPIGVKSQFQTIQEKARANGIPSVTYHNQQPAPVPVPAPTPTPAPEPQVQTNTANVTALPNTAPLTERKGRGPRPAPVRRYSVDLPVYVIDDIIDRAHKKRITRRQFVMQLLKEGGIDIKKVDLDAEADANV